MRIWVIIRGKLSGKMTKPSILLSVCLFVLVFISCLMKVKNFEPSNSKKIKINKMCSGIRLSRF